MMVSRPEQWIAPMADAGVNLYTFHIEPVKDVAQVSRQIQEAGMKVGLAIKPGTKVSWGYVQENEVLNHMLLIQTGAGSGEIYRYSRSGAGHDCGARLWWAIVYGRHDAQGRVAAPELSQP